MEKRKKPQIEFRYYKMPEDSHMMALLGEKWVRSYGEGIDYLHFHNYLEIGYCYEGQGTMTIGENDFRFSGEQFAIIPQNCLHTTTSDPGTISKWEYLYIDVDAIIQELYPNGGNKKKIEQMVSRINAKAVFYEAADRPEMAEKIRRILDVMRDKDEFYKEEAKELVSVFLISIARENPVELKETKYEEEKTVSLLTQALDYINEHYMEPIRIEQLAKICYISETHFRRIFSSCMKMGPLEYINLVRIQKACEMLRKTNRPIYDIAYKCGFPTPSTFNRNFKRITGNSPIEWRKFPENFEQQVLQFQVHTEQGW
jgi:AraC-like DNA-binding protein